MGSPGTAATPQRPATGRPNNDHRQVVEAMVWLARTGSPWRDLPAQYGSWKTVASRFYRWRRDGLFERLLAEVHRRADACGELDWLCHDVDGTVVRAHQHAAGARKGGSRQSRQAASRRWDGHGVG